MLLQSKFISVLLIDSINENFSLVKIQESEAIITMVIITIITMVITEKGILISGGYRM